MSRERWQQLDQVFADALDLPVQGRAEFVARACGANHTLQTEVLSLLAAADASGEFMAAPALDRLAKTVAAEGLSLRPGERVGSYTVIRLLGSGGAGEVWRARDERLGRDVAIKVLLPYFATDTERLRRFGEEARLAGALNHANILAVYDVGEHRGAPFLVSECLEGESLRKKLEAGLFPIDRAVTVALAIARGLAAAHTRGIVHRDLKPDNVFIRADGGVKILDFGLAKLHVSLEGLRSGRETITGAIVGTAGYMAPEQVRGEEVDPRADLFALGVIFYEMLGGQHPFKRASTFETLHAILTTDPPDLSSGLRLVPPPLAHIVMRLLEKTPEARFQSALDLAWALEQFRSSETGEARPHDGRSVPKRSRRLGGGLAAAVIVTVLAGTLWFRGAAPSPQPRAPGVTRFTWMLPAGVSLDSAPVVSPDSRYIAFVGAGAAGTRLYIRAFDSLEANAVPASDGARQPFWSPDSQWIGFFARQRLMKVSVAGGAPMTVVDNVPDAVAGTRRTERGGAWSRTGTIVYGADHGVPSLSRVSADGGAVTAATVLTQESGDSAHRFPAFLPDAVHFVYFVRGAIEARRGVYIGSVDGVADQPRQRLLQSESEAVYVPLSAGGHGALLYVANGHVEVQRFDPVQRSLVGHAQPIPVEAGGPTIYQTSMLSASSDALAYSPSAMPFGDRISSIGESGDGLTELSEREAQQWPRVSPDGRSLAWLRIDPVAGNADIWVENLTRHTRVRVTTALGRDMMHVWSPDGSRLAYLHEGLDRWRLSIIAADGSGAVEEVTCPRAYCEPTNWATDGKALIVNAYAEDGIDVWAVATSPGGASRPLLAERFTERDGRVSPDGRWIAYVSEESGRPEVSIRSLADPPRRYVISPGGGDQPVWQRNGRALFYVDARGRLRKVAVHEGDDGLTFGTPIELNVPSIGSGHASTQYDVAPDGRIYFLDRSVVVRPTEIRVVLGWQALLSSAFR